MMAIKNSESVSVQFNDLSTIMFIEGFLSNRCENSIDVSLKENIIVNEVSYNKVLAIWYKGPADGTHDGNILDLYYVSDCVLHRVVVNSTSKQNPFYGNDQPLTSIDTKEGFDFECVEDNIYLKFLYKGRIIRYFLSRLS